MQPFESRRFRHNLLEALQRRSRSLTSNQKIDPTQLGQIIEQHGKPNFTYKSRRPNQQDVLAGENPSDRKGLWRKRGFAKAHNGSWLGTDLPCGRLKKTGDLNVTMARVKTALDLF